MLLKLIVFFKFKGFNWTEIKYQVHLCGNDLNVTGAWREVDLC